MSSPRHYDPRNPPWSLGPGSDSAPLLTQPLEEMSEGAPTILTPLAHPDSIPYDGIVPRVQRHCVADLSMLQTALAGRYTVEREVGRGGMATVYLAQDLKQRRRVAVKVLRPELTAALNGERFSREIRITAYLQHPNILPVFDWGEVDGVRYYVMPYVDGESLAQRLEREDQLPIDDALDIASEIAEALGHAHLQGLVHRDVKPSNILLSHGHAVLADFGIARAWDAAESDQLTEAGLALGTVAYMSPEQGAGGRIDARTDIYSLGCTLYEMLAGAPPFTGGTPQAVRARHAVDPVPSLRTVRDTVPPTLERAIVKAMAKVPADRFASAAQFKEAIRRSTTDPGVALSRHRSRIFAGLATAILVVAAIIWRMETAASPDLDVNRVIVYPLVVPDNFSGPQTTGEDVATMIGSALDGTGPLRWIDGWPLLDPALRNDMRRVPLSVLRALAQSRRCGYLLSGRMVVRGDSVDIFLQLQDVRGDSTVARGKATGTTADAWRVGLRAVNEVLPTLIPTGTPDVAAEWRDRAPAAVASFLLGESEFRRVHLPEALAHYREAVAVDSSFALAAIRGAQAATWNHHADEAWSLIRVAIRQKMSPRYTHFARGYEAYLNGDADSAASEFRQALTLDPEMSVAWMQLGEVYTHLLPRAGNLDSLAEVAFEEAHRLDPSASNLLLHLIEIRLRRGEVERAAPMIRQFVAARPDTILAQQVEIMQACVQSGTAAVSWNQAATVHPLALLSAASSLSGYGSQLPCAREAFDALLLGDTAVVGPAQGRRWSALIGLQNVLLMQGRTAEAAARLDSSIARGVGGSSLFLLDALVVEAFGDRAREIAQHDADEFGPNYAKCPFPTRLWHLGLWEAHVGHASVVTAIARDLNQRALRSGSRADRLMARSMEAHAALARADTNQALRLLNALVAEPVPGDEVKWDLSEPLGMERLLLARLLLSRGRYRQAIEVANVIDSAWPSIYPLYVPASLALRAEAAAALGNQDLASRFRGRLAALRSSRAVATL